MKQCATCDNLIDERYSVCSDCHQKSKVKQFKSEVSLSHLNNNLYAIRKLLELQVKEKYELILEWDKNKKDFVFKSLHDA